MATARMKAITPTGLYRKLSDSKQQVLATEGEQDQQQVAGEHVGEQTKGQRGRPDDDGGEELQRDDQDAGSGR